MTQRAWFHQPRPIAYAAFAAVIALTVSARALAGAVAPARVFDPRDALLAALGNVTLECLGTLSPALYRTTSGVLERTFEACTTDDTKALIEIDALLGIQFSEPGQAEDLAGHYVATWNRFTSSFPYEQVAECPIWELRNVIDSPTFENVKRHIGRVLEENRRYRVKSPRCGRDGACAVTEAKVCAGGFGSRFVVEDDARSSTVTVDPVSWLVTYVYPTDSSNPFMTRGFYHAMSQYGVLPGAQFGALQRAGERCSKWMSIGGYHDTNRTLWPIDCGGYQCATYCF